MRVCVGLSMRILLSTQFFGKYKTILKYTVGFFLFFLERRFIYLCIYLNLFIFSCVGSSFLCEGFLQLWRGGATLHRGAQASPYLGLSCCGAQAPDVQAQ